MFSIQKLFARDDKFFELLAASAEESRASVQVLKGVLSNRERLSLEEFAAARRKEKKITEQISELLARTSITSLDREDIEAISSVLYKIPKTIAKFAEHYMIAAAQIPDVDFSKQIVLLDRATATIVVMIRELEKSHFDEAYALNEDLQKAENEADELMIELIKDLYSGNHPPLKVIILKDLYEMLEKVVDRCRDVGNVIANVVLKNS